MSLSLENPHAFESHRKPFQGGYSCSLRMSTLTGMCARLASVTMLLALVACGDRSSADEMRDLARQELPQVPVPVAKDPADVAILKSLQGTFIDRDRVFGGGRVVFELFTRSERRWIPVVHRGVRQHGATILSQEHVGLSYLCLVQPEDARHLSCVVRSEPWRGLENDLSADYVASITLARNRLACLEPVRLEESQRPASYRVNK